MIGEQNKSKEEQYNIRHTYIDIEKSHAEYSYYHERKIDLKNQNRVLKLACEFNERQEENRRKQRRGEPLVEERRPSIIGEQPKENVMAIKDACAETETMLKEIKETRAMLKRRTDELDGSLGYIQVELGDPKVHVKMDNVNTDKICHKRNQQEGERKEHNKEIKNELDSVIRYLEPKALTNTKLKETLDKLSNYQTNLESDSKKSATTAARMMKYDRGSSNGLSMITDENLIARNEVLPLRAQDLLLLILEKGQASKLKSELEGKMGQEKWESPEKMDLKNKNAQDLYVNVKKDVKKTQEILNKAEIAFSNKLLQNPGKMMTEIMETNLLEQENQSENPKKAVLDVINDSFNIEKDLVQLIRTVKNVLGEERPKFLESLQRKHEQDMHECNRKSSKVACLQKKIVNLCNEAIALNKEKDKYNSTSLEQNTIDEKIIKKIDEAKKTAKTMESAAQQTELALINLQTSNQTSLGMISEVCKQTEKMEMDKKPLILGGELVRPTSPYRPATEDDKWRMISW